MTSTHTKHTTQTYVLRVDRASNRTLADAVARGDLRPTGEILSGLRKATTYIPSLSVLSAQHAVNEETLWLGAPLGVQLWRLPPALYGAVVRASPEMTQFAVSDLVSALAGRQSRAQEHRWWRDVAGVTAAGRQRHLPAQLSALSGGMVWDPQATRLARQPAGWFVCLVGTCVKVPRRRGGRGAAGLDIGLSPLATLVSGGDALVVPEVCLPTASEWPLPGQPGQVELALWHLVAASATRQALEAVTVRVERSALFLAVERIDFGTFTGNFPSRSRSIGLSDWCYAELPQRAFAAGVDMVYVRPAHTSQRCARCGSMHPDQRWGQSFECFSCGHRDDAHVNAAHNIVRRGWGVWRGKTGGRLTARR